MLRISSISDQDEISTSQPDPPAVVAALVLEDGQPTSTSVNAQSGVTNVSESIPDNKHGIDTLDIEAAQTTQARFRTIGIVLMCCLALFVTALDQTIVATAIPSITKDLHSAAGYTWIGAAYLLAMCAANPVWVRISDIWGRKYAVLGAIAVFFIGSTIAAAAVDMPMLISGRGVQGLAGGGIMSLVNIVISDLFSMRHRSLYISLTALVWVVAGTTGPVIGGALSQHASWRWCFWINLPICGVSFFVLLFFLDMHNPRTKLRDGLKAIDWFGTVSIVAVILLLLLGLDFGGVTFPWNSPTVICLIVFGAVLILFFLYAEKRLARYPLVDLGIFNDWSNSAVLLIGFTHSMATRGSEYYLPLYFQSVQLASPTKSGLLIMPMMITAAVCDVLVGILIHKTGRYRELIWGGTTCLTLGTGLYIMLGTDTSLGQIIAYQIIGGIGLSLLLSTPMIAIQNNVSQADVAVGTSTLGFTRSIASSLSLVLGGVVFQNSLSQQHPSLVAAGLSETYLTAFKGSDAAANVDLIGTVPDLMQRVVVQDAYAFGMRNMFILYTAFAGIGLLASPLIKQRHMSTEHTETKTGIENMTKHERKTAKQTTEQHMS